MTNGRNWRIEDYITNHIKFFSVLADQAAMGHHPGMFEKRRVDLLFDGLKNKSLSGVKSNIMCHPQLYNDFNATANHLKDVVNRMPELQTAPGRQVSAMGRGGGCGRGTGRDGRDGQAGHDGRGGRGYDSGCGHGGRGNDRGRRSVKSKHFIGLKSKILCYLTLHSDFNATVAHLNDTVSATTMEAVLTFHLKRSCLGMTTLPPSSTPLKRD